MAVDCQNMTRWAFPQRITDLATNTTLGTATRHDFAAETIYVPETTRSFAKASGGRVMVKVTMLQAAGAVQRLTGVRIGIKINAVAFDDLDVTYAVANSGNHYHLEAWRDVTDYFSTNDPGTASFTCQVGVAFATGTATTVNNVTAELYVMYARDSAATTYAGTAVFPIQSHLTVPTNTAGASYTEIGTDGTGAAPANQIRKLTGSGGAFDSVTGFTLRKRYLIITAQWNSLTTANWGTNQRVRFDGAGTVYTFPAGNNSAGTNYKCYWVLDITALATNAAHSFEVSSSTLSTLEHIGAIDVVTYEFTASSTQSFVSVLLPLTNHDSDQTGAPGQLATTADCERLTARLHVAEGSPTIDQCGVVLFDSLFSGGADRVIAATGQTERTYDRTNVANRDSWETLVHRTDHTSSNWAIAQGENLLSVDVRTSTAITSVAPVCGYAIVNYRCTKHTLGAHRHNKTLLLAQTMSYVEGGSSTATPDEPVIVQSNYVLSAVWGQSHMWASQAAHVWSVGAQRQSGELSGKGWWRALTTGANNIGELGSTELIYPITQWWRPRTAGSTKGADLETERKWHVSSSVAAVGHQVNLWATLHTLTYAMSGTMLLNGSAAGNGNNVDIYAVNTTNKCAELVATATTAGGAGGFSATIPLDDRAYFATCEDIDGSGIGGRSAYDSIITGSPNFDITAGAAAVPDVIITAFPSTSTTSTSASFQFSISSGSAEYSVDGGAYAPATSPINLVGLSVGAHSITIRAVSPNTTHLQTFSWTVANPIPDVIITNFPATTTTSTSASFQFTVSAGSAEYNVDGGAYSPATSPINLAGLSVGSHTVIIRSTIDNAHLQSFTWEVVSGGGGGPDVIITGTPVVETESHEASIAFTISSGAAEYSLDGAPYVPATSPIVLTGLAAGGHVITIRSTSTPTALQSFWWTVKGELDPTPTPIEVLEDGAELERVDHVAVALSRLCEQFKGDLDGD